MEVLSLFSDEVNCVCDWSLVTISFYFSECSINLIGEVLGYFPVVHVVDECIIAVFWRGQLALRLDPGDNLSLFQSMYPKRHR